MQYEDDDGNALGRWVETDRDEFWSIVQGAGGLAELSVFASSTEIDVRVYTEWGRSVDIVPLVAEERRGPTCTTGPGDACTCDVRRWRFERTGEATR